MSHDLTNDEKELQEITRLQWDVNEKKKRERIAAARQLPVQGALSQKEVIPAITATRLALVHLLCNEFKYGELGDADFVLNENQAEKTFDEIRDAIEASTRNSSTQASNNRAKLQEATKTDWKSSRMNSFVETVKRHLKEKPGKMLVFSEFLSTLDGAENALRHTCISLS